MQKLIEKAKACNRQEIMQTYSDPSYNKWWIAENMPQSAYWVDVANYPAQDLEIKEDDQGRVLITRITRKGTSLGFLGGKEKFAREEMYDIRRFSQVSASCQET